MSLRTTLCIGQVYDLSEFMDRHPGGPTTILSWAGKDASKLFNEIHKGVKKRGSTVRGLLQVFFRFPSSFLHSACRRVTYHLVSFFVALRLRCSKD